MQLAYRISGNTLFKFTGTLWGSSTNFFQLEEFEVYEITAYLKNCIWPSVSVFENLTQKSANSIDASFNVNTLNALFRADLHLDGLIVQVSTVCKKKLFTKLLLSFAASVIHILQ